MFTDIMTEVIIVIINASHWTVIGTCCDDSSHALQHRILAGNNAHDRMLVGLYRPLCNTISQR